MPMICMLPAVALYGAAGLFIWMEQVWGRPAFGQWAVRLFWAGLLFHTVYVPFVLWWADPPQWMARGTAWHVLTWASAVLFAVLLRRPRWHMLGVVFFPLLFLLSLATLGRTAPDVAVLVIGHGTWLLPVHVLAACVAVAICVAGSASGGMFLYQEWQLKSRRPAGVWLRLPPLPALERALTTLMWVGFLALTITVVTGMLIGVDVTHTIPMGVHRWLSLSAWVLYGLLLQSRGLRRMSGRHWILLSLLGFLVVVGAFLEVHGL